MYKPPKTENTNHFNHNTFTLVHFGNGLLVLMNDLEIVKRMLKLSF